MIVGVVGGVLPPPPPPQAVSRREIERARSVNSLNSAVDTNLTGGRNADMYSSQEQLMIQFPTSRRGHASVFFSQDFSSAKTRILRTPSSESSISARSNSLFVTNPQYNAPSTTSCKWSPMVGTGIGSRERLSAPNGSGYLDVSVANDLQHEFDLHRSLPSRDHSSSKTLASAKLLGKLGTASTPAPAVKVGTLA